MADDQVFDEDLQLVGEAGDAEKPFVQHLQFDDHVAQQLSLGGVRDGTLIGQLMDLADIVQECAGEQ